MENIRIQVAILSALVVCLGACTKTPDPVKPTPAPPVVGKAVDLGLSVKWADHNVGATAPEEAGNYFAWGETIPKNDYSWNTYTLSKGSWNTIFKYNNTDYYGTVDNKAVLESEDDAASVNWGGDWRMPTMEEMEELRTQCVWKRTKLNGVDGYEVSSNSTGNSIFIPVAGHRNEGRLFPPGCYYWTSSVQLNNPGFAHRLYQNGDGTNTNTNYRIHGMPVRPCCNY